MDRITNKQLEYLVERINTLTNSPLTSYTHSNDKFEANINNYHIYCAYGAVGLHRMMNLGGGVHEVIGLSTKRELYNRMQSFMAGIEAAK